MKSRVRWWAAGALVLGCAATALGLAQGCGGGGGGNPAPVPGSFTINAKNDLAAPMGFSFDSPVTVRAGTMVTWSNVSSAPHSIIWDQQTPSTSPAPGANIPVFGAGSRSTTWTAPAVAVATAYNYHCGIHGPTMAGVINVTP